MSSVHPKLLFNASNVGSMHLAHAFAILYEVEGGLQNNQGSKRSVWKRTVVQAHLHSTEMIIWVSPNEGPGQALSTSTYHLSDAIRLDCLCQGLSVNIYLQEFDLQHTCAVAIACCMGF